MKQSIYEEIYCQLEKLGILNVKEYAKFENPPFMPLSVDRLSRNQFAIAHNFIQNGDVMADPDMEIRIYREQKMAEALNITQHPVGVFRAVYPQPGKVDLLAKKELNDFLLQWLKNLNNQGLAFQS